MKNINVISNNGNNNNSDDNDYCKNINKNEVNAIWDITNITLIIIIIKY